MIITLNKKSANAIEACIDNNYYPFCDITGKICEVRPMETFACKKVMDEYYHRVYPYIQKNQCYQNSIIAAAYFKSKGIDVKVVEGRYEIKDNVAELVSHERLEEVAKQYAQNVENLSEEERIERARLQADYNGHRWLMKGDKFFDPTCDKFGLTKIMNYLPERAYEVEPLIAYHQVSGIVTSSLNGIVLDDTNSIHSYGYINKNYEYVSAS